MQVIPEILKVIGLILLIFAGLLILILMLLLFAPVRSYLTGTVHGKEARGELTLKWLFGTVFLKVSADTGSGLTGYLRVLWFKLLDGPIGEEKNVSKGAVEETPSVTGDATVCELKCKTENTLEETAPEAQQPDAEKTPGAGQPEVKETVVSEPVPSTDTFPEEKKKQKFSVSAWISDLTGKLKEELDNVIKKCSDWYYKLISDIEALKAKISEVLNFIKNQDNQKLFRKLLEELKKVLRQLLPRKGKGSVTYGLGDPYITGKVLEVLAVLFPLYGEVISVCPEFDNKKLDGWIDAKGRIYLVVLLGCFVRVYFNKEYRKLYGELKGIIGNEQSE